MKGREEACAFSVLGSHVIEQPSGIIEACSVAEQVDVKNDVKIDCFFAMTLTVVGFGH